MEKVLLNFYQEFYLQNFLKILSWSFWREIFGNWKINDFGVSKKSIKNKKASRAHRLHLFKTYWKEEFPKLKFFDKFSKNNFSCLFFFHSKLLWFYLHQNLSFNGISRFLGSLEFSNKKTLKKLFWRIIFTLWEIHPFQNFPREEQSRKFSIRWKILLKICHHKNYKRFFLTNQLDLF